MERLLLASVIESSADSDRIREAVPGAQTSGLLAHGITLHARGADQSATGADGAVVVP